MSESSEKPGAGNLSEVVDKTKGFQPWRRVFHATNGTLVVLALTVFGMTVPTAIWILGVVLGVSVVMDVLRLLDPKLNVLFFRTFSSLASPREETKLASSTWYALSALLVLLLFPKAYALGGILTLAWADPAANIVGKRWGRRRFLSGTVRGTGAFALVAFLALALFVPWWLAFPTAVLTAVVEASPVKLDDNLIVPVTAAIILQVLGG